MHLCEMPMNSFSPSYANASVQMEQTQQRREGTCKTKGELSNMSFYFLFLRKPSSISALHQPLSKHETKLQLVLRDYSTTWGWVFERKSIPVLGTASLLHTLGRLGARLSQSWSWETSLCKWTWHVWKLARCNMNLPAQTVHAFPWMA